MTNIIKDRMPLVASQAGVWDGEYIHLDAQHREIDRHKSRLVCRLNDGVDGVASLSQSNIYTWADDSQEIRYFEGIYRGDRLWVNNEIIDGWIANVALDATNSSIFVHWTRPTEPGFRYYEMITVAADGKSKNRAWHWYRNNELFQRTLINEVKVSDDWQAYDDEWYLSFHKRGPQR